MTFLKEMSYLRLRIFLENEHPTRPKGSPAFR